MYVCTAIGLEYQLEVGDDEDAYGVIGVRSVKYPLQME
jgi:hypothetical protein